MWQMREQGHQVGRYRVRSLVAECGLKSREPGHRYKRTGQARVDPPNRLDRNFDVDQPNEVWCGDISYIWAGDSWKYLAVVLDLHTRRVVGSALSSRPNGQLVCEAFENAVADRKPKAGLVFHSDQGGQYTSSRYRRLLWCHRIT